MRAAVLTELGRPLEILDGIEVPPLQPGQVLVDLAYSGVCHSQVMEASGARGPDPWLPHMLGHEASGRVSAIGEGVTKVKPGDLVILGWIRGQGREAGGCRYHHDGRVINAGGVTTFSDRTVASENRLTPLPDGVPLDVAVLFGCALPTGAGLVLHEVAPDPGTTIAFFGLGGIGAAALMAASLHHFETVFAVDIVADKLTLARDLGADEVIDAGACDPVEAIRERTGGAGVDYAVEASGVVRVIEQAFDATRQDRGLTVFASHPPQGHKISLDPHALISGRQIRGSWGGAADPDVDTPRFAAHYRAGKWPLERLVSGPYRLDQINQALADLAQGRAARPVVEINPDV